MLFPEPSLLQLTPTLSALALRNITLDDRFKDGHVPVPLAEALLFQEHPTKSWLASEMLFTSIVCWPLKKDGKYQAASLGLWSESCMALATPRSAWINSPLFLHLVAPSQVNMAALFGLAWVWHWFIDVHLPPKLKLLSYSVLSYLARNYPQRDFTEAQGRIVSPPVTMPGKPGGQFDVLAANFWTCYLEKWVQLYFPSGAWLANGKVTYHRKGKSSKNKFQPHMEVEGLIHTDPAVARPLALVCGSRSLGSSYGWFPVTPEGQCSSGYFSPTKDACPREWTHQQCGWPGYLAELMCSCWSREWRALGWTAPSKNL